MRALMIPAKHTSTWSGMGIVRNTLDMYAQSLKWYPRCQHFFLVSGDSVPVKGPTFQLDNPHTSITGAVQLCSLPKFSSTDGTWYTAGQWMMLIRTDVDAVLDGWKEHAAFFVAEHMRCWDHEHGESPLKWGIKRGIGITIFTTSKYLTHHNRQPKMFPNFFHT